MVLKSKALPHLGLNSLKGPPFPQLHMLTDHQKH